MPIILNENIQSNSPKSLDNKYMINGVTPYADVAEVNSIIPLTYRSIGLTVNIANVEYWYKDGVADTDLILKCCSSLIEKTHAEMITLKTNSEFVKGQQYLITDFRTRHEIPNTTDFFIGVLEPLIVEAVSETEISTEVLSTTYPNDIIRYNLIDDTIQGGDRGRITYRLDTISQLSTFYDWKNVKFRRWQTPNGFFSLTDNGNPFQDFYTFQNSINPTNSFSVFVPQYFPFGFAFPVLNNTVFINSAQTSFIETAYFGDNTFVDFVENTITAICIGNICTTNFQKNTINGGSFGYNTFTGASGCVQNLFSGQQIAFNTVKETFGGNSIFGYFSENTLNNVFEKNTIHSATQFYQNTLDYFALNSILCDNFANNTISGHFFNNQIAVRNFRVNTIGSFLSNVINPRLSSDSGDDGDFALNTIGLDFKGNNVSGFFQNTVSDGYKNNDSSGIAIVSTDFSTATFVYQSYTKTIIKRQDNTVILYYLNNLNVFEYVSPTS